MRVAVVCSDPGIPVFGSKGASVHLQAVLAGLLRRGDEVHLLTPRPGGEAPDGLTDVVVHELPPVRGRRSGTRSGTGSGGAGAGQDVAARELAARHSDAAAAAVLDRLHARGGLDPGHEHGLDLVLERYSLWGATATAWAAAHGVPSVLEVNAPLVREQAAHRALLDRAGAEQVARHALGSAGAVVCVSAGVAAWAREVLGDSSRVHVVPNGVDTARITPVDRPGGVRPLTVGFVGTLKPWHGTEHLVDALALLRADPGGGGWRLLLVGDGPEREALLARAARLGVADAVEATGALPPEQVAAQLHRMDVGCAPYEDLADFYFSPLKVYEYLAAGLPVVASRVPGMADLLREGRLGSLVRPGDPAHLAAALRAMALDPDRRAAVGRAAREAAVASHTWDSVVGRVVDLAAPGRLLQDVGAPGSVGVRTGAV